MRQRRTVKVAFLAGVLATAGALAGCTGSATSRAHPDSPASALQHPATDRTVADARRRAAMYDYTGAEHLLAHDTSAAGRRALAAIKKQQASTKAWPDTTRVSHVFYHSLIVDPARAFAKTQPQRAGYAQYMVTKREFRAQLRQMYAHGYVLVHPQRLVAKNEAGVMRPVALRLPPGKKPLVLSVDDVSYYEYMKGAGFATNLTLRAGKVTNTYVDAAGRTHYGAYDVPTVIDDFVRAHPDFSYHGDKGTIALTGYNGILGYRSSVKEYGDTAHTRSQQRTAKTVATDMKTEGWHFASHTWGHINMTTASLSAIKADSALWDAEVRPLVGPTDELVYPFGADISGMPTYTAGNPKFAFLHNTEGFDYFFPIDDSTPAWSQLTPTSWRQARINVDGISMQRELDGQHTPLEHFFNTRATIDPARPLPLPQPE